LYLRQVWETESEKWQLFLHISERSRKPKVKISSSVAGLKRVPLIVRHEQEKKPKSKVAAQI
jgi:hypothetical protein